MEPSIHLLEGDAIEEEIFIDIIQKPDDVNELYVSGTSAIYWSHDMGDTWELLPNITPENNQLMYPTDPNKKAQRIALRTTAANPNLLYIFTALKYPGYQIYDSKFEFALFNRTDYSIINYHNGEDNYAPYRSQAVAVSPIDESIIYYGNAKKMKKLKLNLNGETITSTNLFSVNKDWHDDIHYLKFASDNQSIWMAHDGGIAKGIPIEETDDSMIFNWQNYYSGLGVSNLYNMASSESKPTNLLYGAQDTGCNIKIGTNNWKEVNLGDGYAVKFHPSYPNISFVSSQNYFRGSLDNGNTFDYLYDFDQGHGYHMDFNHQNDNILYSKGNYGVQEVKFNNLPYSLTDKTIRNLSINQYPDYQCYNVWSAPNDENVVYAHLIHNVNDHLFVRTTNVNDDEEDIVWENLYSMGGWDNIYIAEDDRKDLEFPRIAIDDEDPLKCWLIKSLWGDDDDKIFLLEDNVWSVFDPEHKLGIINPNSILHQHGSNDRIYVGTDRGIFYTQPSMDMEWVKLNGVPHAEIREININNCAQKIRVATFGRGIWEADMPPLDSETLISENQTWETKYILGNSLRIQTGNTLTINSEVQLPKNAYIYVEKGAKLIIDGGHLYNACGLEWAGIFVEGEDNLEQGALLNSEQGFVWIKNEAIIEGAHRGVKLIGYTPQGGIEWGSAGGVLIASNSTFKNCKKAIAFYSYQNTNTVGELVNNNSRINACDFIVDQNYYTIFGEDAFVNQVSLWDVHGVKFVGCNFEMPKNLGNGLNEDRAISSRNAAYTVIPHTNYLNGEILQNSKFSGFDIAIDADNSNPLAAVHIKQSIFEDNNRAITLSNMLAPVIVKNTITIGPGIANGGIYLYETNQYIVEENSIIGTGANSYPMQQMGIIGECGIYIDNINNPTYNEIYKNDIQHTYFGLYLKGNNNDTDPNVGLEFLCNDFGEEVEGETDVLANYWDVYINGEVAKKQGRFPGSADPNTPQNQLPAGNRFSDALAPNGEGNIDVALNNGFFIQSYLMHPQFNTDPTEVNEYEVFKQPLEYVNYENRNSACPSHWYVGEGSTDPTELLNDYDINVQLALIETEKQSYTTLYDLYKSIIDKGMTSELLADITDFNKSDAEILEELVDASPYLSDKVMIKAIMRQPALDSWDSAELLVWNSPLSRDVVAAIDIVHPFTPFLYNFVVDRTGYSQRFFLDMELAEQKTVVHKLQKDHLYTQVSDSINTFSHQILNLDQNSTQEQEQIYATSAYIKGEDWATAQSSLVNLPNSNQKEILSMELSLKQNGKQWAELSDNKIIELVAIANNEQEKGYMAARSILSLIDEQTSYQDPLPVLIDNAELRVTQPLIYNTSETKPSFIHIYPNPVKNEAFILVKIPDSVEKVVLSVYNSQGALTAQVNPKNNNGFVRFNTSSYASGMYMVELYFEGMKVDQSKFIVVQ